MAMVCNRHIPTLRNDLLDTTFSAVREEWQRDTETSPLAAHYEHNPYGNLVYASSEGNGNANPFRFSTKWFDAETHLGYWGYRYYSPRLGRWISRDPIEEKGTVLTSRELGQSARNSRGEGHVSSQEPERAGEPLYLFVENSPIGFVDYIGLACMIPLVEEYEHNFGAHHRGLLVQGSDWDYGPGGPWYYSFGVSPWDANPAPTPANTRYIRQLRNDVFAWFRELEDGQAKGKKCRCATCADIYSCIKYRSEEWNGTFYDVVFNNCWDFVTDVKDQCCLERL